MNNITNKKKTNKFRKTQHKHSFLIPYSLSTTFSLWYISSQCSKSDKENASQNVKLFSLKIRRKYSKDTWN